MSDSNPEALRLVMLARAAMSSLDDVQKEVTLLLGSRSHMEPPEFSQVEKVNSRLTYVRSHLESMMTDGAAREKAITGGAN